MGTCACAAKTAIDQEREQEIQRESDEREIKRKLSMAPLKLTVNIKVPCDKVTEHRDFHDVRDPLFYPGDAWRDDDVMEIQTKGWLHCYKSLKENLDTKQPVHQRVRIHRILFSGFEISHDSTWECHNIQTGAQVTAYMHYYNVSSSRFGENGPWG